MKGDKSRKKKLKNIDKYVEVQPVKLTYKREKKKQTSVFNYLTINLI